MALTEIESAILKILYALENKKQKGLVDRIYEKLSKSMPSITKKEIRNTIENLVDEEYISIRYDTTPLADREIGTER